MSVSVRFFASIREKLGKSEEILTFQGPCTVAQIWDRVTAASRPPNLLVALNQEYVSWDQEVRDGDEVAFFPPVTGG